MKQIISFMSTLEVASFSLYKEQNTWTSDKST